MKPSSRGLLFLLILTCALPAFAGGPLVVGGPSVNGSATFGVDGQPFTWNPARMPIAYRLDPGPMAVNSSGQTVIDHATGAQRVQNMFGVWQSVSTAKVSFTNAGALLNAGSYTGGDVTTAAQFNAVIGSCQAGAQNPVIFDADGKLLTSLGFPPEVIGFNQGCATDAVNGFLTGSAIVLNGKMQDKVSSQSNFELSANAFDEAITHEIGHFLGLDHSQINLQLFLSFPTPCDTDNRAGLPLMFPISFCPARKDVGLPVLSPDDVSWISSFYPNTTTADNYGTISGKIFFGDGVTAFQGINVIARQVDDPNTDADESRRVAVSAVSGYLFTANPGQSVTGNDTNGDRSGSRNPSLVGYYQIAVPPGTYTVEIEAIDSEFVGGSSVGPLSPPAPFLGPAEFWNHDESGFDIPQQRDTITVHPRDNITNIDIILNEDLPRFDQYEDSGSLFDVPMPLSSHLCEDVNA